ncbi:extracellular solute-binding protein [Defluviitoga tunisiensis]|jgi:multiple sugar transport system substrate-binding protein|uniref:ABC-type sugar transport system, periplasmic component n=1 Tax=Defluviitoga tunisiensis TaxID=1006576 RepID=A0A0C7P158_DEFTU|nr:extracellular solute-binding protein [Defluviitoga tunisiensis]CEP78005.1 ABC-type sugar transport system, periplasmic component [Defluviitoga tunisiensis]HOB55365.1 extracellular solute-binding protein [Defluviitoga tunisiensis]HPZ66577.1 extracellular solute-binding protein [Defluviitoga tunisiensis]HQD63516.1 extracellular solute-binding protein [Defluviitoga sp.]
MKKTFVLVISLLVSVFILAQMKELIFWHSYSTTSGEYKLLTKEIIPEFEKAHPEIKVTEVQVPYDEMRKRLIVSTAAAQYPDVMRMDIIWVPQFADIGVLLAIDKEFPQDFAKIKETFLPGPLSTNYWKGNYYGVPLDTNTRVLLWNKKMFEEAGLKEPPNTMEEFIEYIKILTKDVDGDGENDQWGFADTGFGPWNSIPWIYSFGGQILDTTNSKAEGYVNSSESVEALKIFRELYEQGYIAPIGGGGIGVLEGYAEGIYAMTFDGPWAWSIIKGQYPEAEINFALVPQGKGGSRSVVGGEDIVIFNSTKYKEESWEFVKYMTSKEVQLKFATVGQMPVLKGLLDEPEIKVHLFFPVYLEQLETAVARSPHPAWNEINDIMDSAWQNSVIGGVDPKKSLDNAAKEIEKILQKYK